MTEHPEASNATCDGERATTDPGRRRVSQGIVLLVLLGTLLPPARAAAAAGSSKLSPGARYVAIGSSYAAGFGIRPQEPRSGSCGRSEVDYPHLVAAKLRLQLDDVSCGGAVTANALDTRQNSAPPQIDAVTPQTRLVTLTIGGNDVDYVGTAIACGQPNSTCRPRRIRRRPTPPFGLCPTRSPN
jgi:hypothetical protein